MGWGGVVGGKWRQLYLNNNKKREREKGKFIALNTCIRKEERSLINHPNSQLKNLEKEWQIKHEINKWKEIIKSRYQ